MTLPVVAIVGRPNVGKSSLFNRVLKRRVAIVADEPGTTRDRVAMEVEHRGRAFILVDTGGLEMDPETEMRLGIRGQVDAALREADVIVFLTDVTQGVVTADSEVAQLLRKTRKPVVLAVNKVDNRRREPAVLEFYELGIGDPIPVSAFHDDGVYELLDAIVRHLPPEEEQPVTEGTIQVAIVGRPNVGKSMLVNAILGQERVVVSDVPGTTRDAIDIEMEYKGQPYVLIDTAGMRRRGHQEVGVEKFSVMRSISALQRADVAVLVVDVTEPLTAQDLHVAGFIKDAFKGLVVFLNKVDLIEEAKETGEMEAWVRARLKFLLGFPVVFGSALQKKGVTEVLDAVKRVYDQRQRRVGPSQLNRLLAAAMGSHVPPSMHGRRLSIFYGTQAETNPPTFVIFVNDPTRVHFSYRRYLENTIRREFGYDGTPIRLIFRGRAGEEEEAR